MAPRKRKLDEVKDKDEDAKQTNEKEEDSSGKKNPGKESKANAKDTKRKKDEPPAKKSKNRCGVCSKSVGLSGITCRCGGLFCGYHRYTDRHKCPIDYKSLGAEEIKKKNPRVTGKKIDKV